MGVVVFYQKHPTLDVRMMIQMTWLHKMCLWGRAVAGRTALNEKNPRACDALADRAGASPAVTAGVSHIFELV